MSKPLTLDYDPSYEYKGILQGQMNVTITFDVPDFMRLKEAIKAFRLSGYIEDGLWWIANLHKDEVLDLLLPSNPVITEEFANFAGIEATEPYEEREEDMNPLPEDYMNTQPTGHSADVDNIEGLNGELLDFQKEAVQFLINRGYGLVADEMGLGKTIEALAYIQWLHNQLHDNRIKALIIPPASLKINWKREVEKWNPELSVTYISSQDDRFDITDIIIINYDLLSEKKVRGTKATYEKSKWEVMLSAIKFNIIVLDESHYIKNEKAKRSKAVLRMRHGIFHKVLLTGTPILSRPEELINQLEFLDVLHKFAPEGADPRWHFLNHFCDAKQKTAGGRTFMDTKGAINLPELNKLLIEHCMIRRRKKEVLKQLPPKRRQTIYFPLSNRKKYEKVEADVANWVNNKFREKPKFREQIEEEARLNNESTEEALVNAIERSKAAEHLTMIEALKQTAVDGKLLAVIAWVQDFIEMEKLVLFGVHTEGIQQIAKYFGDRAVMLTGDMKDEERQESIDRFQDKESGVRLFVANLTAGGVGITLTEASNVAFFELAWTPGHHVQAEDRVHRIGQDASSVNIYYLVGEDTVEEDIAEIIEAKAETIGQAIDGIQNRSAESHIAANILRILRKKHA